MFDSKLTKMTFWNIEKSNECFVRAILHYLLYINFQTVAQIFYIILVILKCSNLKLEVYLQIGQVICRTLENFNSFECFYIG